MATNKDPAYRDKFKALQTAIAEGIESGTTKDFDIESFKKRMLKTAE
jgi:hypothetical protein